MRVDGTWNAASAVRVGCASQGELAILGGRLDTADLTVGAHGELVIDDGGTLAVTGGTARLSGLVAVGSGSTIRLDKAHLLRDVEPLDLSGGGIVGIGLINAPFGVMLGAAERPGSLTGAGPLERLVVNGDVAGSGSLTHVNVYGHVSIGDSAGEMSLANVLLAGGSSVAMEVLGPAGDKCDRLLIGPGVDFAGCPIEIAFAGGFTPDDADTFDLFDELPGGDLAAALAAATIHTPTDWQLDLPTGTLSYVPEQAALGLLLLGGVGLLRRRRRT
jgi:MYXO-CTERM domain-containing protein